LERRLFRLYKMFKAAAGSSVRRMLHRTAGGGPYKKLLPTRTGLLASSAVLASVLLYSQRTVYSDALDEKPETPQWSSDGASLKHNKSDTLNTIVWGSNRCAACSKYCHNLERPGPEQSRYHRPASAYGLLGQTNFCAGVAERRRSAGPRAARAARRVRRRARGCVPVG
jgi:hypothetical protein